MTLASTAARGYGAAHQAERRRLAPIVAAGQAWCWRCGGWIPPGTPWELGHDDHDRSIYRGPEHLKCNRAAGARKGNRSPVRRLKARREWGPPRRNRICAYCFATYDATYSAQRTCSRRCATLLRRQENPAKGKPPFEPPTMTCTECGTAFTRTRVQNSKVTCSPACATQRNRRIQREHYASNALGYRDRAQARNRLRTSRDW